MARWAQSAPIHSRRALVKFFTSGWGRQSDSADRGRRHRRRRRAGRCGGGVPPGQAGLDVLLLEKTRFPREKVCGDGLTPRAVKQLVEMGIDTEPSGRLDPQQGPARHRRRHAPRAATGPTWRAIPTTAWSGPGSTSTRCSPTTPQKAGAELHEPAPRSPARSSTTAGRVVGVEASRPGQASRVTYRAPLVIAADGVCGRLALAFGIAKRDDRPMGVAVRRYYYTEPAHDDDYLESWLELWDGSRRPRRGCCPATAGSSASATAPSTSASASSTPPTPSASTDYRALLRELARRTARGVGLTTRTNADRPGPRRRRCRWASTARRTTRAACCWSATAGGAVNPFNGEGIAYAMETGEMAAEVVVQALARPDRPEPRAGAAGLRRGPARHAYGGYYRLGGIFVAADRQPAAS